MPNIETIIAEFETIAKAQGNLNSFGFGETFEVKIGNPAYPMLLIRKNVHLTSHNLKTKQRVYAFKLQFYGRKTDGIGYQLETVAEQFLNEFRERYKASGYPWNIENEESLSGIYEFRKHQDRIVQIDYDVEIRCQGEVIEGTFNYEAI